METLENFLNSPAPVWMIFLLLILVLFGWFITGVSLNNKPEKFSSWHSHPEYVTRYKHLELEQKVYDLQSKNWKSKLKGIIDAL